MDIPNRTPYSNYPAESSFISSESVSSRTPLTASRESPTSPLPNGHYAHDGCTENPYEMPLNFEIDRIRHENEMIQRRSEEGPTHKKKQCLVYEPANGNMKKLRRQFSDEEDGPGVRYIHHHAKTYKCTFIVLFFLVFMALGMGALGVLAFFKKELPSQQIESTSAVAMKG